MKKRLIWSVIFLIPTMYIASHNMFKAVFGLPVPEYIVSLLTGRKMRLPMHLRNLFSSYRSFI